MQKTKKMTTKALDRGNKICAQARRLTRSIEHFEASPACKIIINLEDGKTLTLLARKHASDTPNPLVISIHNMVEDVFRSQREELEQEFNLL